MVPSGELTWQAIEIPFLIGDTSSQGLFSVTILVQGKDTSEFTNMSGWKIPMFNRKYIFKWWIFQRSSCWFSGGWEGVGKLQAFQEV